MGFQIWSATDNIFCHFGPFFALLPPLPLPPFLPNNPENQNFEKLKKATGAIIILHKCTYPFTLLTAPKFKI